MYFEDVEYLPISKVYITRLIHSSFFFQFSKQSKSMLKNQRIPRVKSNSIEQWEQIQMTKEKLFQIRL